MTEIRKIYRCGVCGNTVEIVGVGGGTLVCCKVEMKEMVENTTEASKEKHIPVIEKTDKGYLVKVGSVPHPMEEKHYIQFIELTVDGVEYKKFLKPSDKPEAEFCVCHGNTVYARELCNLHGLWKA